MTPKQARLVLRDSGLDGLINCTNPAETAEFNDPEHFKELYAALVSLRKLVKKIAKRKVRRKCPKLKKKKSR